MENTTQKQQVQTSAGQQPGAAQRRPGAGGGVLRPPVDVIEDASGITLLADMPGVSKDNLNLRLEAQSLTIEGSLQLNLPPDIESRYAEVQHQQYERTFALSRELDGEKATAELANGVLKIRIPKTAEAAPRKIAVNTPA
ncbi:MAG: Hsp20/alpha crystallin family protein [Pseudomonadota bacterium]